MKLPFQKEEEKKVKMKKKISFADFECYILSIFDVLEQNKTNFVE